MNSTKRLQALHKKGMLQLVEPSPTLSTAYYERARKSLSSAKLLLEAGNLEDATALSYYAMYHSLQALLFLTGVKCESHNGSICILRELYEQETADIESAKKERIDKQYYTDFMITAQEVQTAIQSAEEFVARMKQIIDTLQNSDIQKYREYLQQVLRRKQ